MLSYTTPFAAFSKSESDAKANLKDDVGFLHALFLFRDKESRGFFDANGHCKLASYFSRCCVQLTRRKFTIALVQMYTIKQVKYGSFKCMFSDLSVLTCGFVTKNSTLGLWPQVLFLVTRSQSHMDKSENTL